MACSKNQFAVIIHDLTSCMNGLKLNFDFVIENEQKEEKSLL
jgi:hypothetical protein